MTIPTDQLAKDQEAARNAFEAAKDYLEFYASDYKLGATKALADMLQAARAEGAAERTKEIVDSMRDDANDLWRNSRSMYGVALAQISDHIERKWLR